MFTGIISHIGTVERIEKKGDWLLRIAVAGFTRMAAIGASISCSGACLTVIEKDKNGFTVQASQETISLTTLGSWKKDTRINLERALKVGDELGGHFVSGHVDGQALVEEIRAAGESKIITLSCHPRESGDLKLQKDSRLRGNDNFLKFIAPKGSVTLDGVSLTVNEVKGDRFTVNIIPHTLENTTLGSRKKGDRLNLEIDLLARYLARLKET